MNENQTVFELYKQYLIQVASKESRPFRLPKNKDSLDNRIDACFFYVLKDKLIKNKIKTRKQIRLFMEIAVEHLVTFHITDVIDHLDEIITIFKNTNEDDNSIKLKKIKIAFQFLKEYCIINDINAYEDLLKGSPPILLKLWKQGKIDDRVIVSLFDFDELKKKSWYRIYCGAIVPKIKYIKNEIKNNVEVISTIENELLKFKTTLNK